MRLLIYSMLALVALPLSSSKPVWQWMWVLVVAIIGLVHLIGARRARPVSWPTSGFVAVAGISIFIVWGFVQALVPFVAVDLIGVPAVDNILTEKGLISVDPALTIKVNVSLLSHLVLFALVYEFCSRRQKAVNLVRFCGVVIALFAAYGFVIFVSGNETILWYKKWTSYHSLTSTFLNRNSFAAFAGLGLQCLIAYAFFWAQDELAEGRIGREFYRHLLESMLTKAWWLPLVILVTAVAILLSNSRGGFGSVAVATLLLFSVSPNSYAKDRSVWKFFFSASALVAVSAGLFSLSGNNLEERLGREASLDTRFDLYPLVIDAILDRPMTGFGLGTFDDTFRLYQDATVTGYFDRAHSDYLELAFTAGIPASVLLLISLLSLFFFLIASLKFGNQYRAFIALGITVMIQLGLHSVVDFSLQKPGVSYMWVAIIAASVATAHRCRKAAASNEYGK